MLHRDSKVLQAHTHGGALADKPYKGSAMRMARGQL
jgi:hypothetical protein